MRKREREREKEKERKRKREREREREREGGRREREKDTYQRPENTIGHFKRKTYHPNYHRLCQKNINAA